jgi:uncharacterized protein YlzI (FlbEa/FlbD family)
VEILAVLFCLWNGQSCVPAGYAMTVEDVKGSGVRFTRPDGTSIYVNPRAVAYVRAALPDENGAAATIVFTSGAKQSVKETVEEVIHGIAIDKPELPFPDEDTPP